MHARVCTERLQAAQHDLASMRVPPARSHWAWTFYHPDTRATCRAVYDGAILSVTVEDVPVSAGPHDWDEVEEAFDETYADLEARGIARTALPNVAAVLRELRLVASGSLQEIV